MSINLTASDTAVDLLLYSTHKVRKTFSLIEIDVWVSYDILISYYSCKQLSNSMQSDSSTLWNSHKKNNERFS